MHLTININGSEGYDIKVDSVGSVTTLRLSSGEGAREEPSVSVNVNGVAIDHGDISGDSQASVKMVDGKVVDVQRELTLPRLTEAQKKYQSHFLWTQADKGIPSSICDIHGQIVLDLCKICGRGECELDEHFCSEPRLD